MVEPPPRSPKPVDGRSRSIRTCGLAALAWWVEEGLRSPAGGGMVAEGRGRRLVGEYRDAI